MASPRFRIALVLRTFFRRRVSEQSQGRPGSGLDHPLSKFKYYPKSREADLACWPCTCLTRHTIDEFRPPQPGARLPENPPCTATPRRARHFIRFRPPTQQSSILSSYSTSSKPCLNATLGSQGPPSRGRHRQHPPALAGLTTGVLMRIRMRKKCWSLSRTAARRASRHLTAS